MGKKRIVTTGEANSTDDKSKSSVVSSKKRVDSGILHVQSTYNNTKVMVTDKSGNALMWGSSGG
ncbi:MAG: 30S ribosomal protein S11, partial [Candidatus Paceibacterota bacterium]